MGVWYEGVKPHDCRAKVALKVLSQDFVALPLLVFQNTTFGWKLPGD